MRPPRPSPAFHPSGQLLADFIGALCPPGVAFIIDRHCAGCARCRSWMAEVGAPFEAAATAPIIRPWRRLGPGLTIARVGGVAGLAEIVYAVQAQGGADLAALCPMDLTHLLLTGGVLSFSGRRLAALDFLAMNREAWPFEGAGAGLQFSGFVVAAL